MMMGFCVPVLVGGTWPRAALPPAASTCTHNGNSKFSAKPLAVRKMTRGSGARTKGNKNHLKAMSRRLCRKTKLTGWAEEWKVRPADEHQPYENRNIARCQKARSSAAVARGPDNDVHRTTGALDGDTRPATKFARGRRKDRSSCCTGNLVSGGMHRGYESTESVATSGEKAHCFTLDRSLHSGLGQTRGRGVGESAQERAL